MLANRANLRCFFADDEMSAVAALPHGFLALLKDCLHFHITEQCAVTLLVGLLNLGDLAELESESGKALLLCLLGKAVVHVCPLVILSVSCGGEILCGVAQCAQRL